ncbi:MAG TPA: hypothetical protein VJ818_05060 [Actinomycetota bacterium]|nr:hypothetical protein [Actinomycetota bacterium]
MARAPTSGPTGAIWKLPAPLLKAGLVIGVVGSTLGATLLVASVTGANIVRIPALAGPSYARDVSGFHPITSHTPVPPATIPTTKTPTTLPSVAPSVAPGTPAPKPERSPSPPQTPPAAAPSLSISMSAGAATVRKNREITYAITVTNTGSGAANDVVIESHVPDGASLTSWVCNASTVQANGATSFTCGSLGSAPAPNHPLVFAVHSLSSGSSITERFTVTVDPNVRHNSAIVDHAHAYATNADLADSNSVSVIVR